MIAEQIKRALDIMQREWDEYDYKPTVYIMPPIYVRWIKERFGR